MKWKQLGLLMLFCLLILIVFFRFPDTLTTLQSIAVQTNGEKVFITTTAERQIDGHITDYLIASNPIDVRYDQTIVELEESKSTLIKGINCPSHLSKNTIIHNNNYFHCDSSLGTFLASHNKNAKWKLYKIIEGQFRELKSESETDYTYQTPNFWSKALNDYGEGGHFRINKVIYEYSCDNGILKYNASNRPFEYYFAYLISIVPLQNFEEIDTDIYTPIRIKIQRQRNIFYETCDIKVFKNTHRIIKYISYRMILLLFLPFIWLSLAILIHCKHKATNKTISED